MRQPTRLLRDSADRYKLKVTLPGGQYQLSLDDRAVVVLTDHLGLSVRDQVPEPFVPFFIAMGDAWFPRQRDMDAVIEDLPSSGTLSSKERSVLISYITTSPIAERNETRVRTAIKKSPIADEIDPSTLQIQPLPSLPNFLQSSDAAETPNEETATSPTRKQQDEASNSQIDHPSSHPQSKPDTKILEAIQQIPGIGPHRSKQLVAGGIDSLTTLADTRPIDLTNIDGISEDIAAVAVEGAREVLGHRPPASERLARQTGVSDDVFTAGLASLAASGVPASEAVPTLRVLYGPTVADIDAVSGQQAYFLWEAGYQTPHDIVEASTEELTDVFQVGSVTASEIQDSAHDLMATWAD